MQTDGETKQLNLLLALYIPSFHQQSKKEKEEQKKEAVMKLIESENYKIDINNNTAMPMRGHAHPLTSSPTNWTIRNDLAVSYCLPLHGLMAFRMAEVWRT